MKIKTKILGRTSLGRAPISNVKCLGGLKEGEDYSVDLKAGIVIPLRDLGKESYEFEFDWTEPPDPMIEAERIRQEQKQRWANATDKEKLDILAERIGLK